MCRFPFKQLTVHPRPNAERTESRWRWEEIRRAKTKRVIDGAKERRPRLQANFSWHQHPSGDMGRLPTCLFSLKLQILNLAVVWCQEEILWDFSCSITKQLVIHSWTLVKRNRCCKHFHAEFEKSWTESIKSLVTRLVTVQRAPPMLWSDCRNTRLYFWICLECNWIIKITWGVVYRYRLYIKISDLRTTQIYRFLNL